MIDQFWRGVDKQGQADRALVRAFLIAALKRKYKTPKNRAFEEFRQNKLFGDQQFSNSALRNFLDENKPTEIPKENTLLIGHLLEWVIDKAQQGPIDEILKLKDFDAAFDLLGRWRDRHSPTVQGGGHQAQNIKPTIEYLPEALSIDTDHTMELFEKVYGVSRDVTLPKGKRKKHYYCYRYASSPGDSDNPSNIIKSHLTIYCKDGNSSSILLFRNQLRYQDDVPIVAEGVMVELKSSVYLIGRLVKGRGLTLVALESNFDKDECAGLFLGFDSNQHPVCGRILLVPTDHATPEGACLLPADEMIKNDFVSRVVEEKKATAHKNTVAKLQNKVAVNQMGKEQEALYDTLVFGAALTAWRAPTL